MADSEAVQNFINITGAPAQAASFYLESAKGDLETAINAYLEGGGSHAAASPVLDSPAPAASSPVRQYPPSSAPANQSPSRPTAASSEPRRSTRQAASAGKIRSLADLGESEDDENSDEANEYYAGGEKSGQVVKGAPKDGDEVEGLFDRARQAGARQGTAADLPGGASAASASGSFTGTARTLKGDTASAPAAQPSAPPPPTPQEHVITFWRNNIFTVNDGEPRSITAPVNREFLDAVVRGECPRELEAGSAGAPVNVSLLRRNEDYVPPQKPRNVPFAGAGRTLAGPSASSGTATGSVAGATASGAVSTTWEGVDEAQPTTSLQLRLTDGSRMVARFNLSHTVADIRRFIMASRPDIRPPFRLATAFPAAALDDESVTIEQAGLQNAVLVQKSG